MTAAHRTDLLIHVRHQLALLTVDAPSEQDEVEQIVDEALASGVIPFDAGARVLDARLGQQEAAATVQVLRAVEQRLAGDPHAAGDR